jgi:hypothetical protein
MPESNITRRWVLKGAGLAGAAAVAGAAGVAASVPTASAAATEAQGDKDNHAIVGAWRGTATVSGLGSFGTLLSFAVGGTIVHSAAIDLQNTPTAPNLSTPSYGAWTRTGANTYAVRFEFFTFDTQTNPSGSGVVTEHLIVNGNDLSGSLAITAYDAAGNVIPPSDIPGTIAAKRIEPN